MSTLRAQRLSVAKRAKQQVAALYNDGGYFVYAKALPKRHGASKLIIRIPGQKEIRLTGTQAKSLKKVINAV